MYIRGQVHKMDAVTGGHVVSGHYSPHHHQHANHHNVTGHLTNGHSAPPPLTHNAANGHHYHQPLTHTNNAVNTALHNGPSLHLDTIHEHDYHQSIVNDVNDRADAQVGHMNGMNKKQVHFTCTEESVWSTGSMRRRATQQSPGTCRVLRIRVM